MSGSAPAASPSTETDVLDAEGLGKNTVAIGLAEINCTEIAAAGFDQQ